jgi:hypothetical protein
MTETTSPQPAPADNGGPAFPHPDYLYAGPWGMTLRDYFAAKAMQGLLSAGGAVSIEPHLFANEAAMSYAMADAMLKARQA